MGFVRSIGLPKFVTDSMTTAVHQSTRPAATHDGGKTDDILQLFGGMVRQTTTSARKQRHPLPRLPRGMSWPVDFNKAPEFGRYPKARGGVVAYLRREWREIIAARKIDMPTLRENFPKAAKAINTYTTNPDPKTGRKRTLPKKLTIPNLPQVNDQKLARVLSGKEEITNPKEARRLGAALGRRLAKAQPFNLS